MLAGSAQRGAVEVQLIQRQDLHVRIDGAQIVNKQRGVADDDQAGSVHPQGPACRRLNFFGRDRIHPARIEEVVAKVTKKLEEEILEIGKRTCIDLGIHNMKGELTRMVGRMKYRSSYGQNLLQHSREVANLCATMAAELGLDTKAAKRAGLLHDIGKVSDEESELPHALLGMKIAERCGEKPDVLNAIGAHHDEIEMTTLLSPIVQVCDAISGARPGARRCV